MTLRFHEIAEANHRILNPFTDEKLMLLGVVCRLEAGQRQLDLACGKGEMLCRWAQRFGIEGVGVELAEMVLADQDSWDRYVAGQWWTLDAWLLANPDHQEAAQVRQFFEGARRWHLAYGRRCLGWGVFVGRPR